MGDDGNGFGGRVDFGGGVDNENNEDVQMRITEAFE